jgi:hypothetical protein
MKGNFWNSFLKNKTVEQFVYNDWLFDGFSILSIYVTFNFRIQLKGQRFSFVVRRYINWRAAGW